MRQRNVKNKKEIIENSRYVIKYSEDLKGTWNEIFGNAHPIYLEIGMGKGNFILENAKRYPDINFVGIEKFDSILALALKKIDCEDLPNLRVIRMDALDVDKVFQKEITKLYLNFSDPWPKKRHANRRLTSPVFEEKYQEVFLGNQLIEIKTDNQGLFEYSLEVLSQNNYLIQEISLDLHKSIYSENNILTEYEARFSEKGNPIFYVKVVKH